MKHPKPIALYRHFDVNGTLLYVGISGRPIARLSQHRQESGWLQRAVRMETQWFSDATSASIAELQAIETEKPLYNKPPRVGPQSHRCEPTVMLASRIPESLMARLGAACEKHKLNKSEFVRQALENKLRTLNRKG